MEKTEKRTYSVEEAGKLLGVSRMTAYKAVWKGDIPTIKIGRRLLVPKKRFDEMLTTGKRVAKTPTSISEPSPINELEFWGISS